MEKIATVVSSPNIALTKYWGKRNDLLKLPLNDSISITLDNNILQTRTTLMVSEKLKRDVFILNGKKREDAKISEAMSLIRERFRKNRIEFIGNVLLISSNNFPTGAGIASSASGFSALAFAICEIHGISSIKEKSIIARLGSGSASRSIIGGFVRWNMGKRDDGEDCYARQISPKSHWPQIIDVLGIISSDEKKTSSNEGMRDTAKTSGLLKERIRGVGKRNEKIENAIREKDFETLAIETMKDSNNMHATMLDTWPPIIYLGKPAHDVISAIHELNAEEVKAGYTFDAGPNAHVITIKKHEKEVRELLSGIEGVNEVVCAPVGDGPKIVEPDTELVEKTLKIIS